MKALFNNDSFILYIEYKSVGKSFAYLVFIWHFIATGTSMKI